MDLSPASRAVVGIAAHHDRSNRRGGWAVISRVGRREAVLYGVIERAGLDQCHRYGVEQAIRALRKLNVPLQAIEVTLEVKQALLRAPHHGKRAGAWETSRQWWASITVREKAGLRVTRKPDDAYGAAQRLAEVAAITGIEKVRLTQEELDTPANRVQRTVRAKVPPKKHTLRHGHDSESLNDYECVTRCGFDSSCLSARQRRHLSRFIPGGPSNTTYHSQPPKPVIGRDVSLDDLLAQLAG